MRIRASDEKRRTTQQIGRRDEQTRFRRNRNTHPPHSLSSNSRDTNPQSTDSTEQRILSEEQKHSSAVARVHYQKQRSREVATKGHDMSVYKNYRTQRGLC